ncbi:efflux RND transporter permease subunit [Erythrobacter sp. YT30]|uniref:efflux RND transporter permease subunit n=1 Tax=Erythrobacter sp. YT30 TaxID=1735012 RepID=UPI00076C91E5|nr:efflux RND transporter permease subunit [Erythrobacter sp. YT30]KWV91346.1 transporter [Erythrobacter sp. YT30]
MNFRNLSAWSIRNPVIPLVMFTALLFAGIVSFARMDITNNPEIEFPGVSVRISQPGAAPTEIENQITQQVESAVRSINGVKQISSTASEGSSFTFVEFEIGEDPDAVVTEVKNAVDRVRGSLPEGILEPNITKAEVGGGFLGIYAVEASDMTIEQLSWFIDDTVAKRLLDIEGMAEAGRFGGVDREIEVILDTAKMQALGITASDINNVLRTTNVDAAGGLAEVGGTRQSLRVLGNNDTAYELSQRQLQLGGGRTVRLGEVARVRDGFSERQSISEVRDKEVVNFFMSRARGASDVTVFENAKVVIEEIQAENPDVRFIPLFNTVKYTESQYKSSMSALIEGAVLAVVVVFFFLRDWRATFISAVAIPLSAIPTFFFMDLLGFNLNFLSLLALGLVAGVLVDDAIVEIENIVRHMRMGKTAYQASIDAADEIGLPVVATSFCIVAVFLPVGLMPGVTGQFFKNFGLTVVVAVLMSLAVARMITPLMAAYFLSAKGHAEHGEGPMMDRYLRILAWTLDRGKMNTRREGVEGPRWRWLYVPSMLLVVVALLGITGFTIFAVWNFVGEYSIPGRIAGTFSDDEFGAVFLTISKLVEILLLVFASLVAFAAGWLVFKGIELLGRNRSRFGQSTQYLTARFYDHRVWMLGAGWMSLLVTMVLFSSVPGQFQPDIDDSNSEIAIEMVPGTTLEGTKRITDQVAEILYQEQEVELMLERIRVGESTIYITLKEDRERSSIDFQREMTPILNQIPDARVRFVADSIGFGSGRDMSVMLAGSDPELLNETATTLVEQMKGLDSLVAPRIGADLSRPEILIKPNEQLAAELGVSTLAISQAIRIATLGEIEQNAAKFSLSDRQIPIRVKLSEEDRASMTTIENLPVPTRSGGTVPLSRVADIEFGSGPTAIQRFNQNRRVVVGADLASGVLKGNAQQQIDALPILQDLPTGVIRDAVGDDEIQNELLENLQVAIVSGVLLVFACLVLLYKRLMSPLVNMTSLALAPLGGIMLIWFIGMPQSMPVYIGTLLLLGIVSKNSILLIDFAIEEMERGTNKFTAIMEAGHKRAQPIVMTTVAMTAGMVPTAISLTGDGAWRQPMGIVVIGGLIMSTVLTLLIVPAGFSLADGFERRVGPWLREKMLTYKPGDESRPYGPATGETRPDLPMPGSAEPETRLPPGALPAE